MYTFISFMHVHMSHMCMYKQLESEDFRVFVLNSYPNARIICEVCYWHLCRLIAIIKLSILCPINRHTQIHAICAYILSCVKVFKRQYLHPKYTWITYGWYAEESWTNGDRVDCTDEQLRNTLKKGISIEIFPIPDDTNATTIAGLVRLYVILYHITSSCQGYLSLMCVML